MVLTFYKIIDYGYTTSNAVSVALASVIKGKKTVIVDLNFKTTFSIQDAFIVGGNSKYFSDVGIDSLMRTVTSQDISRSSIEDSTIQITDNLHIVPKTANNSISVFRENIGKSLKYVLGVLDSYFDVVIVDVGRYKPAENDLLKSLSSVMVECVPQCIRTFNAMKGERRKDAVFAVGNYCSDSKIGKYKLKSTFGSGTLACIEHSTDFADAMQKSELLQFMLLNKNAKSSDPVFDYFDSIEDAYNTLRDLAKRGV